MTFITVTANQCNQQGIVDQRSQRITLRLHKDLIGAFQGNTVLLKGGTILNLGGHFYTNFSLGQNMNLDNF